MGAVASAQRYWVECEAARGLRVIIPSSSAGLRPARLFCERGRDAPDCWDVAPEAIHNVRRDSSVSSPRKLGAKRSLCNVR